ncbi:MAG: SURF1 family protein [Pseudomonadales bacterium]
MSLANKNDFSPGWPLTVFTLVLLWLMTWLGFWQLERAAEKREFVAQEQERRIRAPVSLMGLANEDATSYVALSLHGEFDQERYFLLDNQLYRGKFGYEIIVPFFDQSSSQWVLVSRGWLPGSLDRAQLPVVDRLPSPVGLLGEIYVPLGDPFLLADQVWSEQWPKVIQAVDIPMMSAALQQELFAYVVRLKEESLGVYGRHWMVVNMPPEKHTAYAVQWFVMSVVLLLLYIMVGLGKLGWNNKQEESL